MPHVRRHLRRAVLVLQRHLVQNDLLIFRLAATHPQRSAGSASLIKGAGQPKNGSVAVVLGLVFGPVKTREAQQEALYHFMDTPAGHNMPQEMREEIMMKGWRLYPKRIGGATDDDAI